ncbi:MAG TPA: hypothetical protein VG722_12685, partial [Tepidisphaeraceae bacterium]|nr:hypothetical protein [Tepidisphaeraceae bacterium]
MRYGNCRQWFVLAAMFLVGSVFQDCAAGTTESWNPLTDRRYPIWLGDWPITVGNAHQFFVDDNVIAQESGFQRVIEKAEKCPLNPIVRPEHPWEKDMVLLYGSVIRDPETGHFTMWYLGRNFEDTNPMRTIVCRAVSDDGIHWTKPNVNVFEYKGSRENNIVMNNHGNGLDTFTVFVDPKTNDPHQRYRMVVYESKVGQLAEGLY